MLNNKNLRVLTLAVVSIVASFVALGFSLERWTEGSVSSGEFRGVSRDGWISNKAELKIPFLPARGDRLAVTFSKWRPAHVADAKLQVRVCAGKPLDFLVAPSTRVLVPLKGGCDPRSVSFEVLNPFVLPGGETRELGAQVSKVEISSKLGIPLPGFALTAAVACGVFTLLLLVCYSGGGVLLALAAAVGSGFLIHGSPYGYFYSPVWLWTFLTAMLLGVLIGRHTDKKLWQTTAFSDGPESRKSILDTLLFPILLVAAALAVRVYGLSFGLPNNYHPDEVPKVNAIMTMAANHNLDPNYFLHPSLLLYCTYFVNTIIQWVGSPFEYRTSAFLAGRIVSALAGSASVYLLYLVGCRIFSRRTALIASAILAFSPLHVTCSRYLKEDSLLCFLLLATIFVMLKAVEKSRGELLLFAGLLAGLSASTKYSGFTTAGVLLAAPFLRSRSFVPDRQFTWFAALSLIFVPVGFILGSPYAVLNSKKFLSDFGFERRHMLRGHTQAIDAWSQYWMYHFSRSVVPGLTLFDALVGTLGLGVLVVRRKIEDLFIVGLVLAFYLPAEWVKAKPAPQPERYIFPCLPFLALAAGEATRFLAQNRRTAASVLVGTLLIVFPLVRTARLAADLRDDTRRKAARWMVENLPKSAPVYLDWQPYAPYLKKGDFDVEFVLRANIPSKLAIQSLKSSGKKYLVLSSLFYDRYFCDPNGNAIAKSRIRNVFTSVPILKEFTASSGTYGFHNPRLTLFSLDAEAFSKLEAELKDKREGKRTETSNDERSVFKWKS